ncbi:RagB/SusD family nutrient uptake outer membrane protein [Marinilabiliaceae bacterium JC017]|nr:RagB/SusD family nutrient uptake outer membrane protein [Marinilabiliaceae bacterium JC017]
MNKLYIIITLLLSGMLSACDSTLEESPEYTLNGKSVFAEEQSAQLALNACYGYLAGHSMYGQNVIAVEEVASGLAWSRKGSDALSHFASLRYMPDDNYNRLFWKGAYKTIGECNAFIADASKSSLERKEYMIGQAKFIRGLAYYNLVFVYGDVPLRIGASTADNIHMSRTPKAKVLEQVISDFVDATQSLKDTEADTSVPSKVSAYAMLAKVYFLMGSAEGAGSKNWVKAKQYGDEVFKLAGNDLPLEPVFEDLFSENTTESVESIFKLNYSMAGVSLSYNKNSWMYSPYGSTKGGIHYPNRRVSKSFFKYFTVKHPGDPRLDVSFFHSFYTRYKKIAGVWKATTQKCYPTINRVGNQMSWAFYKKHFDSRQSGQTAAKTFFVYRFADFLLLMADVENELGNTTKAVEYVNKVLKRARESVVPAALEPADLDASITQDVLRQFIFDERLFELVEEGHSFIETRRRGYEFFRPIIDRHNSDPDAAPGFDSTSPWSDHRLPESKAEIEKAFLMPIPQSEISTNNEISVDDQNQGY